MTSVWREVLSAAFREALFNVLSSEEPIRSPQTDAQTADVKTAWRSNWSKCGKERGPPPRLRDGVTRAVAIMSGITVVTTVVYYHHLPSSFYNRRFTIIYYRRLLPSVWHYRRYYRRLLPSFTIVVLPPSFHHHLLPPFTAIGL